MAVVTSRRRNKKSLLSAVPELEANRMTSNVVKAQACAVDKTLVPYAKVQGLEGG